MIALLVVIILGGLVYWVITQLPIDAIFKRIALVVLTGSTKWSRVREHTDRIAAAVAAALPGSYAEVEIPLEPKSSLG